MEWIDESQGKFVLGSKNKLVLLNVDDVTAGLMPNPPAVTTVPGLPEPSESEQVTNGFPREQYSMTAVEVFEDRIYVAIPSGRINIFNADLSPTRMTDAVDLQVAKWRISVYPD